MHSLTGHTELSIAYGVQRMGPVWKERRTKPTN